MNMSGTTVLNNNEMEKINLSPHKNDAAKPNLIFSLIKHPFFIPGLYGAAGTLIIAFLILIIATHVFRLKVQTAVVSAQIETMVAPAGGYITHVYVTPNQLIKKGMPLLKIENFDLERELQLARVQVEEANLMSNYYQTLLINEQQRLKIYKKIGRNRVISASTALNISKQDVMSAQHDLERYKELYKKNYISKAALETKDTNNKSAQERLRNSQAQHRMEKHALKAIDKGMYFTGTKTEGIERDLTAKWVAAQRREKLNANRVKIYKTLITKLTLLAPFDGKITQILKSVGTTTDNIKPVIFIEKTEIDKNIVAYLTQDEVISIGASPYVKVYIPSSGKLYHGKITEINRTDGFVDVIKAQYRWRDFQVDRSAMVTIAIQAPDSDRFNQQAFSGMPATVYFSKSFKL